MSSLIVMLIGQMLLITPFGFGYLFYAFSVTEAIFVSMLIRFFSFMPFSELSLLAFLVTVAVLIAVPLALHWLTRERTVTYSMIPVLSIFFFGLLLALSNAKNLASTSFDGLFLLTVALFVLISISGLNISYRTMVLSRELRISDRNRYLGTTKDNLLQKFTDADTHADIDLLTYYLSSSLDSFVYGDFDKSFMDAFKIIDNKGKAFSSLYTLPMNDEQWRHLRDIRNNLSHARITENTEEETEKKEYLKRLKELRKGLFQETLNILKMVRFQFIDAALKNKQSKSDDSEILNL
jgi:hypothetical protein